MSVIEQQLQDWNKLIEERKETFSSSIFDLADKGELSKLDAIKFLTEYELLPVSEWINKLPKFMDDQFEIDSDGYKTKYTIFYYMYDLRPDFFGESKYAIYKDLTLEEGINLTYDYIKEEKYIGCKIDW